MSIDDVQQCDCLYHHFTKEIKENDSKKLVHQPTENKRLLTDIDNYRHLTNDLYIMETKVIILIINNNNNYLYSNNYINISPILKYYIITTYPVLF